MPLRAGPAGPVLIEVRPVLPVIAGAGRPGLGEDVPVRDVLAGMIPPPRRHQVGHFGQFRADDESQPSLLQRDLIRPGDHPGVGDHGHPGDPVRGLERGDHRQHGRGLRLVALERGDHQREPGRIRQQPDRDLWLQPALLGEPWLTEPVAGVGLEIQGGDIEEDQRVRAQRRPGRARPRQRRPEFLPRIHRQPALQRPIRRGRGPGLGQHPGGVDLAGRFDDPGDHQLPEDRVTAGRVLKPQHPVGVLERIE